MAIHRSVQNEDRHGVLEYLSAMRAREYLHHIATPIPKQNVQSVIDRIAWHDDALKYFWCVLADRKGAFVKTVLHAH